MVRSSQSFPFCACRWRLQCSWATCSPRCRGPSFREVAGTWGMIQCSIVLVGTSGSLIPIRCATWQQSNPLAARSLFQMPPETSQGLTIREAATQRCHSPSAMPFSNPHFRNGVYIEPETCLAAPHAASTCKLFITHSAHVKPQYHKLLPRNSSSAVASRTRITSVKRQEHQQWHKQIGTTTSTKIKGKTQT